eukprot:403369092
MSRIKILTLQSKVEYIILSLGGKPDQDAEENKKNLDEFEYTSISIKNNLNTCKDRLKERTERISLYGYYSKERIELDEEIKKLFIACEEEHSYLRQVFKRYQEKNKRTITKKELENRAKNIDLLRRNINLLNDEFKEQVSRMRKEIAQTNSLTGGDRSGDFIDVFGSARQGRKNRDEENDGEYGDQQSSEESDRDLNDEERDILKQFEENDQELENIAAELVNALDEVKMKAQNNETALKRQKELLTKTKKKAEDNENKLRQNNNQLKQILQKYKNGKQMCLDMALCLIFVGLLGILLKMLSTKGYM